MKKNLVVAMKFIEARESDYHAVLDIAEKIEIINLTAQQFNGRRQD